MSIRFDAARRLFHLRGHGVSYVMQVDADELVHHLYWGEALEEIPAFLRDRAPYRRAALVEGRAPDSPKCTREFFHYECPTYGMSDFRLPALLAEQENDGCALCDPRYVGHEIRQGRDAIDGLPSASDENAETLVLHLADPVNGLRLELFYHLYTDCGVITRHMAVVNGGASAFQLRQAMSATVDFADGAFDLLSLDGTTLREFTPSRRRLQSGVTEIASARGISSHQHNPNIALMRPDADQERGDVYGLSMVYSGNFTLRAEIDAYGACRVQGGVNPLRFCWKLEPGERFDTPEIALSYSAAGLNGLSECLHPFVTRHILRAPWNGRVRPLLLNTWEACYFDVSEERLAKVGRECARCGVEMLVLDDGWFGHRHDASSSLGDWRCDTQKFPGGLGALSDRLAQMGLKLGVWVEPEMISPDSDLYRAHPDWCLHSEGRVRTEWRNQLVLDLSRAEVVDYVIGALDALLEGGKIAYVKWDHNRRLTEAYSASLPPDRQGEVFHRYMLGVYRILAHVAERFPDVLLENCASGGGRFDYGMLRFFHQGWLSDNTDPV
ncbi:MAG: alpha-galactosidase, partial [Eubacteriales bacterium]|nr:alpha-galactosidase [Eubacteriales bacterium]